MITREAEAILQPDGLPSEPDASAFWLAWETNVPRLDEKQRSEVEALWRRHRARWPSGRKRQTPSREMLESILESSAACQLSDPKHAKALAEMAADLAAELLLNPAGDVYAARSFANASRLLGDLAYAETAFGDVVYHLSAPVDSLDRAFYCRALALLRWEVGRLDEAGALLTHALRCFGESAATQKGATEEKGATGALVGLLELEQGREARSQIALSAALDSMDLERRPWLTVRASLALALVLASRDAPDPALAVLQEVWRLSPQITDIREQVCMRWWEGRVQARLGDELDAHALLGSARRSYLQQQREPEAALVTLDGMAFLAEAGHPAEAYSWAEELVKRLGNQDRADILSAVWGLRREIEAGRRDLHGCAVTRAASLRRSLRYKGFRIDSLPFA
jgi:tetratricopeptide (TPR) repeat protein